jgi:serine phosphatase RsbU (regulator of sigma subunit)/DNA-binding response OmpR family regulator
MICSLNLQPLYGTEFGYMVSGIITMSTLDFLRPRTLIADDQPDVLEALGLLLKGEGFQTEAVTSPAAALEAIKSKHFDLLLMDLNYARDTTSGQEGLDLLTGVQTLDSSLPIVVMTAWGSVELAVEAMRRGVRDFVLKPWENHQLINILHTQVEAGRLLRKGQNLLAESKKFGNEIGDTADFKTMLKLSAKRLRQALESRAAVIFTRALCEQGFCATAQAGLSDETISGLKFEAASALLTLMKAPFDPRAACLPEAEKRQLDKLESVLMMPIRIKDELFGFVSLAGKPSEEAYDAEEMEFLETVASQIGAQINTFRLRGQENDFEEAREIQRRLLPGALPQIRGLEIASAWRPASVVSGDYYDVLKFSESQIGLCIADVSGKGMPAALLMSNVQAAVRSLAAAALAPAALCEKVNGVVSTNLAEDKFITLFYCLIDAESRRLAYTNAGHNRGIVVRRDGRALRLERGGAVLGPFPEWEYEQDEIELKSGDRVLLFTDGVTEIQNLYGEEFGEERLIDLLLEHRALTVDQLQQTVMSAVADFSGGNFLDDATLIVVSVE